VLERTLPLDDFAADVTDIPRYSPVYKNAEVSSKPNPASVVYVAFQIIKWQSVLYHHITLS
jgi:hypothetical protein